MKKMTIKNLFESIDGLKVEAKKPYYIKSIGRSTRVYVISGAPHSTAGNELYKSLLNMCQAHGAVVEHTESRDLLVRFYYGEDWTNLESEILKEGMIKLELATGSLYRELFERLEAEVDDFRVCINIAPFSIAYASVEEYLETLKTSVKKVLTSMCKMHRELSR